MKQAIAILGAGAWGTALAIQLARNGQTVCLWGREPDSMQQMQQQRCNQLYLPDSPFPETLNAESNLTDAIINCRDIVLAIPSVAYREFLSRLQPLVQQDTRLCWASKGLCKGQWLHALVSEIFTPNMPQAIISGPSFSREVGLDLPTAVVVAANQEQFADDLICAFHGGMFRVYKSQDLLGVEIGGALKNSIAIAVGIADGLGVGANGCSALITRGLAEMMRLAQTLGAQKETLMGLAGAGDLILTCTDDQSRNRRFGQAIGQGLSVAQAKEKVAKLVEGFTNTKQIYHLAQQHHVSMPIIEQLYRILYQDVRPDIVLKQLLTRDKTYEITF